MNKRAAHQFRCECQRQSTTVVIFPGSCSARHSRIDEQWAFSRQVLPELLQIRWPSLEQRAQGKPGADCTRGLVCQKLRIWRTRAYRFSRNIPAFPAQWLYGLLRALPGERALFATVTLQDRFHKLGASIAAPGPHDFAVRLRLSSSAKCAPDTKASIASPAQRIVTIAKRPSCGPGWRKYNSSDLPDVTSGIFLIWGLDTISENQK